ncbi:hypothetical protein F2Q70_00042776 [Brassica cretica]|uniref:Uncharacterized protein n=1 Tax=Brassica cretica TaxID=69181 RepID=A0A8S9KIX5_BRACR|nr:hypothetical protein F2Q70_00042776 [Brassica cretica]
MFQVITRQASVHMCNATVDFLQEEKPFFPPTVNDKALHMFFKNVSGDMLGTKNYFEMQPLMGAEDFSFYQVSMPGHFSFVGMQNEAHSPMANPHSPYFENLTARKATVIGGHCNERVVENVIGISHETYLNTFIRQTSRVYFSKCVTASSAKFMCKWSDMEEGVKDNAASPPKPRLTNQSRDVLSMRLLQIFFVYSCVSKSRYSFMGCADEKDLMEEEDTEMEWN